MTKKKTTKAKTTKTTDLLGKLAGKVETSTAGGDQARRAIKRSTATRAAGEKTGGAQGSNISVYLTDGDQLLSRQMRARLALDCDCGLSQSQLLRVGLQIMDAMDSEQIAAVADRVKALDGRRRS